MVTPWARSVQRIIGEHAVVLLTTPFSPGGARWWWRRWAGVAGAGECRHQHPPLRPRLQLERGRRGLRQEHVLTLVNEICRILKPFMMDCILCYYVWQKYCSWKIEFIGANLSWPLLTDPSKLGLPLILKCILKVVLCHEEVKSYFDFVSVSHVTVSNNEQMFAVCLKSELSSWRPLILPIILFPFVMSGIRKNHK